MHVLAVMKIHFTDPETSWEGVRLIRLKVASGGKTELQVIITCNSVSAECVVCLYHVPPSLPTSLDVVSASVFGMKRLPYCR